jgi:UDP-N-acetylmuramoylalanine--D-glutamate ligase
MSGMERVLILGAGRSGRAAERMLRVEGLMPVVVSEEPGGESAFRSALAAGLDRCIVSPGFALDHPWLVALREAGVPLLAELELGWSRHRGKTVALTGSNGKSTAVKWIAEMLALAGHSVALGGNYGIPACEVVLAHPEADWLVLEVSSFQLETVQHFRPDVGVLLNLLPNHLNRHGSMERYAAVKMRLFEQMGAADTAILPGDGSGGFEYRPGSILKQGVPVVSLTGTMFDNPVLGGCTAVAVAAVAAACGCPWEAMEESARRFEPLPHRLQRVCEWKGVRYINDSKATNLAALRAGVEACGKRVHLIAGGQPKESDYTFIKEVLAERVTNIYLIGQASQDMFEAWSDACNCLVCGTLERAVQAAYSQATEGDSVLLSPGCASFDQFENFEARGDQFCRLVRELMVR